MLRFTVYYLLVLDMTRDFKKLPQSFAGHTINCGNYIT